MPAAVFFLWTEERFKEEQPFKGVRIAAELVEEISVWGQGVYIMPAFGRYNLAAEIIEVVR